MNREQEQEQESVYVSGHRWADAQSQKSTCETTVDTHIDTFTVDLTETFIWVLFLVGRLTREHQENTRQKRPKIEPANRCPDPMCHRVANKVMTGAVEFLEDASLFTEKFSSILKTVSGLEETKQQTQDVVIVAQKGQKTSFIWHVFVLVTVQHDLYLYKQFSFSAATKARLHRTTK